MEQKHKQKIANISDLGVATVQIVTLNGVQTPIVVSLSDPVVVLMMYIQQDMGLSWKKLRLFLNGEKLHKFKRLDQSGVVDGSHINVDYDLDGGAGDRKRSRVCDEGSSIAIMMEKPVPMQSDIQAVHQALTLKEIDINQFLESISLEELEEKQI